MSYRLAIVLAGSIALAGCAKDTQEGPATPVPVSTKDAPPTPTDEPPPPTDEPPTPTEEPPAAGACATLDRAECLSSRDCTMHWISSNQYECRASVGSCETDLVQTDKPTCESRSGCRWTPGSCYCPFPGYGKTQVADKQKNSGGACACGGGAPALCHAATTE